MGWKVSYSGPNTSSITTGTGPTPIQILGGNYLFSETLKPGWITTTGTQKNLTLAPGRSAEVAFGNYKTAVTKFYDKNANGIQDQEELGLAGWRFDIKGPATATRTTDDSGQVNLNDLPVGQYVITENSNDPTWYNTTPINLPMKLLGPEVHFGNDKYRTLKVFKFNDLNKNGKYDVGEPGLPGWEFQISGGTKPEITDAQGIATFQVKANTKYLVSESLPVGWLNSTPLDVEVWIDPARNLTEIQFGDYGETTEPPGHDHWQMPKIQIIAFNDANNNGIREPGEPRLVGWQFQIWNIDDPTSIAEQNNTDINGTINFVCPSEGNYSVEEILPAGWCASTPIILEKQAKMNTTGVLEFGASKCVPANCEYRYEPPRGKLTLTVDDENIVAKKSIDPYVLSLADHSMTTGALINYTITICAKPKLAPADLELAIDTSGSVIETNKAALTEIRNGIVRFVDTMKKSSDPNIRIGLVSWDSNIDDSVPPTSYYNEVINASNRLRANSQELTMYHVGMNGSLAAFNEAPREGAKKVIVFFTDARNEYEPFTKYPDPTKYAIYVLLMSPPQVEETYRMLNETANKYNGKLISVSTSNQIASALETITATSLASNGTINNIKVKDTLPPYLRPLTNGTIPGRITKNADGISWSTTTMDWLIPTLQYGKCWSATFKTVFCWKLQADVVAGSVEKATSMVTYADPVKTGERSIALPEGTIWIEANAGMEKASSEIPKGLDRSIPGFEAWVVMISLLSAAYIIVRR